MTDRLTPGMLRDLAHLTRQYEHDRYRGDDFSAHLMRAALDREESARREAEAKRMDATERLTGQRLGEGPDSAAAPKRPMCPDDGELCFEHPCVEMGKCALPDEAVADNEAHNREVLAAIKRIAVEDKPAPAADDLPKKLRKMADSQRGDDWPDAILCREAADRIEALTARADRLAVAIDKINVFVRAYGRNLHEIVEGIRQTIDALASEGGDRGKA